MKKEDLNFGNVVELKNGELCLIEPDFWFTGSLKEYLKIIELEANHTINLRNIKNAHWKTSLKEYDDNLIPIGDDNYSIMKVYKDYTLKELLWERDNKGLLTNEEREWLKAVVKPFRDKITGIVKCGSDYGGYIEIYINKDEDFMCTPDSSEMDLKFKNLELDKEYSLEELGL